ncbi:uncharacterized protein LOC143277208 [Babylonia areolata]|uniref:uncharacterized protein LOC143277208 n=1 Tax=Babylonia areolata TaxID=304850 RepID=UPI003FCFE63C
MAANLKVATFITLSCVILLGFVVSVYLWRKIGVFLEQCSSSNDDEEMQTAGWKSAVFNVWKWITTSMWQWSHDWRKDGRRTPAEEILMPPCQAPVTDIVNYVLVVTTRDISQFSETAADIAIALCTSMRDVLMVIIREGKVMVSSVLDVSTSSLHRIAEYAQYSFDTVWTSIYAAYEHFAVVLPEPFTTASVIICILILSAVLICWRKHQQPRVRNNRLPGNQYNPNRHASSNDITVTPRSTRSHSFGTELVPRVDADFSCQRIFPENRHLNQEPQRCEHGEERTATWKTLTQWLVYTTVPLLCLSLPWEFCRLYQLAVANKAAVASAGVPLGCSPEQLSLLQTLTLWLSRQLAWSHGNPCDRYYQAMFVDPLWEITPVMVLTSVMTRAIVHPAETLASGLGRALRHFFTEIPLHWQPVCLLLIVTFTFVLLLLACSYRFSIPMLLRIEPRTPVLTCGGGKANARDCGGRLRSEGAGCCGGGSGSELFPVHKGVSSLTESMDAGSISGELRSRTYLHRNVPSDVQKENYRDSTTKSIINSARERGTLRRNLSSERSGDMITARAVLRELDMTSNKASSSSSSSSPVRDTHIKRKPQRKAPKRI